MLLLFHLFKWGLDQSYKKKVPEVQTKVVPPELRSQRAEDYAKPCTSTLELDLNGLN